MAVSDAGRRSWWDRPLRLVAVLVTLVGLGLVVPTWAVAATGLNVYVGYMDTHGSATDPDQPSPWPYQDQSQYVGTPCSGFGTSTTCWDASAVRLDNPGTTDVTGVHVSVLIGDHTFDLWGSNLTVQAGKMLVLTETGSQNSQNFDGSDQSPNDYNGGGTASCVNSGAIPVVSVTIAGVTTTYTDSGQVLNGGGVDSGHCQDGRYVSTRLNESHQWAQVQPGGSSGGGGVQATAPSAPRNLTATAGDGQVALKWSTPSSSGGATITGYNVYRGTTAGGESTKPVATVTGTGYTDGSATNGTTYYYTVAAVNSVGTSPMSGEASATPQAASPPPPTTTAPSAPRSLTAAAGDGSVALSWSAPTSDGGSSVTGYEVYRGTAAGGEGATPIIKVKGTSFTDAAVSNGTTYYYTVAAVNSVGTSPMSNEASATPQAASPPPPPAPQPPPAPEPPPPTQPPPPTTTVPSAPLGLSAAGGDGTVRLTWSAPSSDGGTSITGYRVYRGTVAGGESTTPVADGVTGTGFADTTVTNGVTYYYTVAAVNSVGTSAQSAEAHATAQGSPPPPPPPPPAPAGVCAGLRGCHVMARADVNGDGHRDVIAMARRGGHLGRRGALILRVKTAPGHVVQARRPLENWSGSPWVGVSRLDRRPGKEIMLGRLSGAAASFYQSIAWRHGHLVLLDAPGRSRWWSLEFSATLQAGWQRRPVDPVGTIRRRIATHPTSSGTYRGKIKVYRWNRSGWHLVRTRTVASLPLERALRWGGFDVPGLRGR